MVLSATTFAFFMCCRMGQLMNSALILRTGLFCPRLIFVLPEAYKTTETSCEHTLALEIRLAKGIPSAALIVASIASLGAI